MCITDIDDNTPIMLIYVSTSFIHISHFHTKISMKQRLNMHFGDYS